MSWSKDRERFQNTDSEHLRWEPDHCLIWTSVFSHCIRMGTAPTLDISVMVSALLGKDTSPCQYLKKLHCKKRVVLPIEWCVLLCHKQSLKWTPPEVSTYLITAYWMLVYACTWPHWSLEQDSNTYAESPKRTGYGLGILDMGHRERRVLQLSGAGLLWRWQTDLPALRRQTPWLTHCP